MKTWEQINGKLRHYNRKNYYLLFLCLFFSELLITAYVTMMCSPTVLTILPVGGDSRKQVYMVFALAVAGCFMFTAYTAALFFKYKSRETGIFMALGASVKQLGIHLLREIAALTLTACLAGMLLGMPLAFLMWKLFQMLIIHTKETTFSMAPESYLIAGLYALTVILLLFLMGVHFVRQTDIINVVYKERKSEPVRDVKSWYGWVGFLLLPAGAAAGYLAPVFCIRVLDWYPPAWINMAYLPVFIGLYMILLYTVVHGWRNRKKRYKDIITYSIMKFQGRQTVNSMLVITVLLAGAYFASFYTPMMTSGSQSIIDDRPIDFMFHYRQDQDMIAGEEIQGLAASFQVKLEDYGQCGFAALSLDGKEQVMDSERSFHYEYREQLEEAYFLPVSAFNLISGQQATVPSGMYMAVLSEDGSGNYWLSSDITLLTNPVTDERKKVSFQGYLYDNMLGGDYYVLNEEDYTAVTAGLTGEWLETMVMFNAADGKASYDFAQELYLQIISRTDEKCIVSKFYDRIQERNEPVGTGGKEEGDENGSELRAQDYQSFAFKEFWKYAPVFRVLDKTDFSATYAVFLMLFVFIALICFAAVFIILYTRCMTVAVNSRLIYEDLKHLGAGRPFLYRSIKGQISKVFKAPVIAGTSLMYLFYCMILFMNDGGHFTPAELAGLRSCSILVLIITLLFLGLYRFILYKVCAMLDIA